MAAAGSLFEADLHCHTTASDGLLSPKELICLAAELGLKGIGITDHDTIQGWKEAEEAGADYKIQILKGIELNTDWQGKEIHILGYELDPAAGYLINKLKTIREAREQRMLDIIQRLSAQGIRIGEDEVRQLAQGESIGRPHIAHVLLERGFVGSIQEAFERFIGIGAPAYVPRYRLTTEEGIALIREAHGIPVLAHPGMQRLEGEISTWVKFGLQGIEVSHSEHSSADVARYQALAQQYNLLMTGGSDFHGEVRKPGVELGRWGTSLSVLQKIQELAKFPRDISTSE
ncbi:PHP domain-containing protein [Desulfosporosinus youngiae]|uniref:Putative metal-dependent phosphoesterase, PHP family n=1 Tax=Desulfosporosinus youngiae DSM 17734 TaxID=768710 RepID=H5XWC0_9FIRM|nr:PHP domain-containing protein [Desulfosporosinus youngiae]EHQ90289.1 putative metal-dependent phosphoesterase, PHP family [Desulfosporosinus youngiae DSM 17734]